MGVKTLLLKITSGHKPTQNMGVTNASRQNPKTHDPLYQRTCQQISGLCKLQVQHQTAGWGPKTYL